MYTDSQQWEGLQEEVFADEADLDMTSLNGPKERFASTAICDMWKEGFADLDAVNHLSGNYIIDVRDDNSAHVHAYATATHYKQSAKNGTTREFVGTYDLELTKSESGWRIHSFMYQLKYMQGNLGLD